MRYIEFLAAVLVACAPSGEGGEAEAAPRGGEEPGAVPGVTPSSMASVLDRYDFATPDARFELPGRLDEISGLTLTADGRLFGHDDERGRVHEIDPATGSVGKRFDLGSGNVLDDFEGIATIGERLFLVSSTGFLYEFREGADDADVPYRVTDTGVGANCEVEGLDYDPSGEALLLACKTTGRRSPSLTVYVLPVAGGRAAPVHVDRADLVAAGLDADFQPSALVVTDEGSWILLSAATESVAEVDPTGRVLAGVILGMRRHPQPEGIAVGVDGTLYIADEKNGDDAHVTIYRARGGSE